MKFTLNTQIENAVGRLLDTAFVPQANIRCAYGTKTVSNDYVSTYCVTSVENFFFAFLRDQLIKMRHDFVAARHDGFDLRFDQVLLRRLFDLIAV